LITLRSAKQRHCLRRRGQEIWFTFYSPDRTDSFADGVGVLEVLNENGLPPGAGFTPHARREAEIVTYVLKGALAQKDLTGSSNVLQAGEFQRMTTGYSGRHSERNASRVNWVHFFQIWLRPSKLGIDYDVEQKRFSEAERRDELCIVGSPDGRKGSLCVHQDALIYSAILNPGHHLVHELSPGRIAWLHVVRGEATLGDIVIVTGDGVGVTAEPIVSFTAREETEILLLDLEHSPKSTENGRAP
jgi:redox-sensitive bicupin YhaK (pirin superfamily)